MINEKELHTILSENIKKYRARFKWPQAALAQRAGVSVNFINDIESGKKWASPATMIKIANVFDIQVYELLKPPDSFPDNVNGIIKKYTDTIHEAVENASRTFISTIPEDTNRQ